MLVKTESPFSFNLNFTPTMGCTMYTKRCRRKRGVRKPQSENRHYQIFPTGWLVVVIASF